MNEPWTMKLLKPKMMRLGGIKGGKEYYLEFDFYK